MKTIQAPLLLKVVLLYVLCAAALLGGQYITARDTHTPVTVSPQTTIQRPVESERQVVTLSPARLAIPSLNIDMPIESGAFNETTGEWNITSQAVYFASETSLPSNTPGNTVIYGHNNRRVFGPTKKLKAGDELVISDKNGRQLQYVFQSSRLVEPSDISILDSKPNDAEVTLITCDGLSNELRRLMFFTLKEGL